MGVGLLFGVDGPGLNGLTVPELGFSKPELGLLLVGLLLMGGRPELGLKGFSKPGLLLGLDLGSVLLGLVGLFWIAGGPD